MWSRSYLANVTKTPCTCSGTVSRKIFVEQVETNSFRNLMKRSSRPQLICGTILQVFQQFTGINVIMFYAPVLFQTMGFGGSASLLSAVVTGLVNVASTLVAIGTVDRFGRRVLLLEAVVQMLIAQVSISF